MIDSSNLRPIVGEGNRWQNMDLRLILQLICEIKEKEYGKQNRSQNEDLRPILRLIFHPQMLIFVISFQLKNRQFVTDFMIEFFSHKKYNGELNQSQILHLQPIF